jgi:diguanylate cyclase (GGDEF)-like protein
VHGRARHLGFSDDYSRLVRQPASQGTDLGWAVGPIIGGSAGRTLSRTIVVMSADEAVEHVEGRVRSQLRQLVILKGVDEHAVWGVLEHCRTRSLAVGEVLLTKGQENRSMYFLLEGRLGIHLEEPPADPIAFLEHGQTVGEMSVIDRSPASAHVTAVETALLLEVDDETFWRLVSASHQFAINLLHLLAQRMRANNSNLYRATLMQREFERDATMDALTGLYNRRWWEDKFARIVARAHRGELHMALLVIDVDRFKLYNDNFGHIAGDTVLRVVARTLAGNLRPTDIAARYGGEEFVVALPATDLAGALVAAQRVRQAVSLASLEDATGARLPSVTISLGVATLRANDDAASLFGRADAALYRAKDAGRNRVEIEAS